MVHLLLLLTGILGTFSCTNITSGNNTTNASEQVNHQTTAPTYNYKKLQKLAKQAALFCKNKNLNTGYCLLVDLSMHSGLNRFFIWDLNKDTFVHSFPVSHGCGDNYWNEDQTKERAIFSNEDGSHCSSLGKYKVGEKGYSNWGINIKYLLHGLDETNSNAMARQIVFHAWENVPDNAVYPKGTPEGWGCPAISNNNFKRVHAIIQNEQKPLLMWIFN
ncbi:MAG: murein L,D-transpeptidase catalytic domain family protein [Bacteroidota bacterium]